jgi:hypothetical protein
VLKPCATTATATNIKWECWDVHTVLTAVCTCSADSAYTTALKLHEAVTVFESSAYQTVSCPSSVLPYCISNIIIKLTSTSYTAWFPVLLLLPAAATVECCCCCCCCITPCKAFVIVVLAAVYCTTHPIAIVQAARGIQGDSSITVWSVCQHALCHHAHCTTAVQLMLHTWCKLLHQYNSESNCVTKATAASTEWI